MPHSSRVAGRMLGLPLAVVLATPALIALQTTVASAATTSRPHVRMVHTKPVDVRRGSLTTSRARAAALRAAPAAAAPLLVTPRSTWHVTYDAGFNANAPAKTAFQAAVNIWAGIIQSNEPIEVIAGFEPKDPGLLGQAGASASYVLAGLGDGVSYYPSALADRIYGSNVSDLVPGAPAEDIDASFSSSESSFYFGTDGLTPANKIDFESVVLHELGHGLGFTGGMLKSGLVGSELTPVIYDKYVVTGASTPVQSLIGTTLGSALTGNNLGWNGAQGKAANSGVKPKLFAPSPWQQGSSFSHLDETTYSSGTINALMTPSIDMGEVLHTPGPIVAGIFRDMGWDAVVGPGAPTSVSAYPLDNAAWVTWPPALGNGAPITSYTVTPTPADVPPVVTSNVAGRAVAVNGLTNASSYTFTVKATNLLGDGPSSAPSNAVTPSPVDLTPPVVKLVTKPAVVSKSTTADFTYAGDDFGRTATTLTYLCSLDAALIPCPVAPHYTGLSQGAHVFQIKATDAALNTGPLTTYSWSVDTVAPTVTAAAQSLWTLGTAMTLHYTGADGGSGIASHKVTYRRAAYNGAFPSVWSVAPVGSSTASTITVARGYTYCMAVRFTDKAGNYKDSLTRCTATPLDDGALARSPGWTYSGGHAGYYGGTYTVAKRSLASLTRTGMQTRRISVMALTCASCGSLRVYWNGVLIKTLSLYSSTTKHQILAVKDFGSVKVGTLVLRTASSKAAYVDGLGASRV